MKTEARFNTQLHLQWQKARQRRDLSIISVASKDISQHGTLDSTQLLREQFDLFVIRNIFWPTQMQHCLKNNLDILYREAGMFLDATL